jgi:3'-5' exoribonuclease
LGGDAGEKMKKQFIADLQSGTMVNDIFLVSEIQKRTTKDGSPYLTMTLIDKTGSMKAVLWTYSEKEHGSIKKGDFVEAKGVVGEYNNTLQMRLVSLTPVTEEKVSKDDFLRATQKDRDQLFAKVKSILSEAADPYLMRLVDSFLSDKEFLDKFFRAPAANIMHHPFLGGLLEHTHNVVRICKALTFIYPQADADLLVCGAFLHDIGKVTEYTYEKIIDFSTPGRLKGHLVMGAEMVREKASKIANFPPDLLLKIEHLILSHHGIKEWGSPIEPMTFEANILHFADNMDAKAQMFDEARRGAEENAEWSAFSKELSRHVYLK